MYAVNVFKLILISAAKCSFNTNNCQKYTFMLGQNSIITSNFLAFVFFGYQVEKRDKYHIVSAAAETLLLLLYYLSQKQKRLYALTTLNSICNGNCTYFNRSS